MVSEENFGIPCLHVLKLVDFGGQGQDLNDTVIVNPRPMSDISHPAIARSVYQPANFTMIPDGPGTFNELECERFCVYKVVVRCEGSETLWVSEDVSVSIVEDNAGVKKL